MWCRRSQASYGARFVGAKSAQSGQHTTGCSVTYGSLTLRRELRTGRKMRATAVGERPKPCASRYPIGFQICQRYANVSDDGLLCAITLFTRDQYYFSVENMFQLLTRNNFICDKSGRKICWWYLWMGSSGAIVIRFSITVCWAVSNATTHIVAASGDIRTPCVRCQQDDANEGGRWRKRFWWHNMVFSTIKSRYQPLPMNDERYNAWNSKERALFSIFGL